jgi:hypothetical protein
VWDLPPDQQFLFHEERDRIYEAPGSEEREESFRRLHGRWFQRLELVAPFHQALSERTGLLHGTGQCRVFPAISRAQEHADLLVPEQPAPACLVLRVRTETLLHPENLLALLRREFLHVADMLDADFGYRRELPPSDLGPSFENLLLARYRVLWETTIDGRLHQTGWLGNAAEARCRRAFCRSFRMLGDRAEEQFRRWFDCRQPRHEEMVAFARDPKPFGASPRQGWSGWCPVCRLPCAEPFGTPERLSAATLREIRDAHPSWRVDSGICSQCADLYQARRGVADLRSNGR